MNKNVSPSAANLLFLLSDNHHRALAGCYGHPQALTPKLDALARRGTRFENAYSASPLCCPARAALATGRFPHETGYWDNAITYDGRVRSWMRDLRDGGYEVVSIGKLHFRTSEDDNGWSEELLPMHILDAKGGVHMLLRGFEDEPVNKGQWELYMARSGEGTAPYQGYDRAITAAAIDWLEARQDGDQPWALFISYPSPHPPFSVPGEFYRRFDEAGVALPAHHLPEERHAHPAIDHLRHVMGTGDITDRERLQKITAGYLGLVAHLDHEIGRVLGTLDDAGQTERTRIIYTSDHGDLYGEHGLFGKCCMYEGAIGVPLIMAGPDIPAGHVSRELVSHVDLAPTIVESMGIEVRPELSGQSLWPTLRQGDRDRTVFAEYHATGSKTGVFMLRRGEDKLVHYVGMPPMLFDLAADPGERVDLVAAGKGAAKVRMLEAALREICDPEAVDVRAKADQRAKVEFWGGREAVARSGSLVYTPPPGHAAEIEH